MTSIVERTARPLTVGDEYFSSKSEPFAQVVAAQSVTVKKLAAAAVDQVRPQLEGAVQSVLQRPRATRTVR